MEEKAYERTVKDLFDCTSYGILYRIMRRINRGSRTPKWEVVRYRRKKDVLYPDETTRKKIFLDRRGEISLGDFLFRDNMSEKGEWSYFKSDIQHSYTLTCVNYDFKQKGEVYEYNEEKAD